MSDTDSLDYLQTGFDPSSLTVPRIRSILVSHNVPYPSGAKKPQLLEILEESVFPQAKKILSARARARRTSKGITDADSQESGTAEDGEMMPPPPTPRARSNKRASSRVKVEDSESEVSSARSPTKKTPRASRYVKVSDTETDDQVQKSVRKTRKSEAPTPVAAPKVKLEDDDRVSIPNRRESAFTYDNPFQSGSSPPEVSSNEKTRKSLSGSKDLTRRKSSSRRRTEELETPAPDRSSRRISREPAESIEPTEEFTPEEQLELAQEQAANGVTAITPRRAKNKPSRGIGKGPVWMVLLTLLGGYATWYRQEKLAVGYCGVGRSAHEIVPANIEVPDWARLLVEPQCEPCPQHAYCSENMDAHCESDFILKHHPLALGGLVPLVPTCEPDGEKVRRIKIVADRAVEELRERKAKFECGELVDEAGVPEPIVEIEAEQLKKEVSKKRKKGMGEAEFEELWIGAIGEVEGREEVISHTDGHRKLLASTSLARLPLGCAIKRSFRLSLARYRFEIASVVWLLIAFVYVRHVLASRSAANAAVPRLVSVTLDRLATQAALHAQDKETYPENWISIGQLRDDVLREQHSIRKREALWSKVRKVVEMNANIRSAQRESRSGEISRVWEWIGAVGDLESGERKRRKSGRVSWGTYDDNSSPVSGNDGGPKWEESRPIY